MTRDEFYQLVHHHLAGGLTCKEVTETVTDYLEDALDPMTWVRFHLHLGLCSGCRGYLRQMKSTLLVMHALPPTAVPPDVREELIQRFRCWHAGYLHTGKR